jgi:hypothetical protein
MEIEYFIPPHDDVWEQVRHVVIRRNTECRLLIGFVRMLQFHNDWIDRSWKWLLSIGVREDLLGKEVIWRYFCISRVRFTSIQRISSRDAL